ncbi:YidH family protein [Acidomonas methanolica]|uniref:DUF202 domain-containing protein n=1 Tax=Acidomonas methanolica NBRC 104435 TaxID=1231351 RepID=A0A023D9Z5_ACIMT|nr:DUF202 domain-containing protein [Acidomonas methanolica]MBU2654844.1 DUF202 domain-containing protein [Acidomonas methanolica]TCS26510.1 putative membrane protein [Acidomonas methanolica]GAJ30530.1 hypothetical protein Amme_169_003 [Acidomonas methanolica NBRC 104435]GBQ52142.1 hypothetical protein AA0498_1660 [Acidomonas methanolica]GEL00754.1 hypothetical protein AME01nite_32520 [Acidomonas methanolica NBRC 104435]
MIERYSDHAANERTFLAWIRTALALVAFGCVLAKFDIFLRLVVAEHPSPQHPPIGSTSWIGIMAVCSGLAVLPAAWLRFRKVRSALKGDAPASIALPGLEGWLTGALFLFGLAVLVALIRAIAA